MQSRNRIFKIVVPLLFVTLIGAFVAFNSGWFSKVDTTPKVLETKEKVVSPKTPFVPEKANDPILVDKETIKTQTKERVTSKQPIDTDTSKPVNREIIMSSSKSMAVMPFGANSQVKIDTQKFEPRKKMMSSSKSMPMIDSSPKIKKPN